MRAPHARSGHTARTRIQSPADADAPNMAFTPASRPETKACSDRPTGQPGTPRHRRAASGVELANPPPVRSLRRARAGAGRLRRAGGVPLRRPSDAHPVPHAMTLLRQWPVSRSAGSSSRPGPGPGLPVRAIEKRTTNNEPPLCLCTRLHRCWSATHRERPSRGGRPLSWLSSLSSLSVLS
jgi:hypothetical protein